MDPSQVSFFFRVQPPINLFIYVVVCYSVCFLLSGAILNEVFTSWGSTIGICTTATFWSKSVAGICAPGDGHWPMPGMHQVAAPSPALNRGGAFCYPVSCPPTVPTIWCNIQLWRLIRESPDSLHLPHMLGMGLLFQVWFHLMTKLTLSQWWVINHMILV